MRNAVDLLRFVGVACTAPTAAGSYSYGGSYDGSYGVTDDASPQPQQLQPSTSHQVTDSCGSGNCYPSEITWDVQCDDGSYLDGGLPSNYQNYVGSLSAAGSSTCSLNLQDSFGDGCESSAIRTHAPAPMPT